MRGFLQFSFSLVLIITQSVCYPSGDSIDSSSSESSNIDIGDGTIPTIINPKAFVTIFGDRPKRNDDGRIICGGHICEPDAFGCCVIEETSIDGALIVTNSVCFTKAGESGKIYTKSEKNPNPAKLFVKRDIQMGEGPFNGTVLGFTFSIV